MSIVMEWIHTHMDHKERLKVETAWITEVCSTSVCYELRGHFNAKCWNSDSVEYSAVFFGVDICFAVHKIAQSRETYLFKLYAGTCLWRFSVYAGIKEKDVGSLKHDRWKNNNI